jgi:hypothetical protein
MDAIMRNSALLQIAHFHGGTILNSRLKKLNPLGSVHDMGLLMQYA